jgi:acetoin utilization deacetylase AcuC-like enzyme
VQLFKEYEIDISTEFDKASFETLSRAHSKEYISFVDSLSKSIGKNIKVDESISTRVANKKSFIGGTSSVDEPMCLPTKTTSTRNIKGRTRNKGNYKANSKNTKPPISLNTTSSSSSVVAAAAAAVVVPFTPHVQKAMFDKRDDEVKADEYCDTSF